MHFFAWVSALVMLLGQAATPAPDNVLVLGDSLACGSQWRAKEVKRPNETLQWECKGGTTIEYWSNGAAKRALDTHPATTSVVVFLGTNNYPATTLPNVDPLLKEIRDRKLKCVWVGPTAVRGKKWKVNQLLKPAVSSTCTYVDTESSGISLPDGVHPSYESWLILLKAVWAAR